MSTGHSHALLTRKATIQQAIERELSAKNPDWVRLLRLKKLRLRLKDRLHLVATETKLQHRPPPLARSPS